MKYIDVDLKYKKGTKKKAEKILKRYGVEQKTSSIINWDSLKKLLKRMGAKGTIYVDDIEEEDSYEIKI